MDSHCEQMRTMPSDEVFSDRLDPIIPFRFFPEREQEMLAAIRLLRSEYGFRRFVLVGPSKEHRFTGFPDPGVFRELGEQVRRVKESLATSDIAIGWWCITTIRSGKGPFQSIVRADGSVADEACCPLDPEFRATFSENVTTVVDIARPFWVNIEDDFQLCGGCYCARHLALLAERLGRHYTREELRAVEGVHGAESQQVRRVWGEVKRDSLVGLAAAVREQVDRVAPETRICLCESGASERDGHFTEAVARAFAGNTRPVVRVHGTSYFLDTALDIPQTLMNPLYKRQHLSSDIEWLHESDAFPHTRFFMSSSKMKTLLTVVFGYGLDDTLFYPLQNLENPLEETAYCTMFREERRRFEALRQAAKGCSVSGCEIVKQPAVATRWATVTGRLGIPHTTRGGAVKLLSGEVAASLSDDVLRELLHGALLLDGHAAWVLCQRGFTREIGAQVTPRQAGTLPPFREVICAPEQYPIQNERVNQLAWAFGSPEQSFYTLMPDRDATVVAQLEGPHRSPDHASITRCVNHWGGRVGIIAQNLSDSYVQTKDTTLFHYTKQVVLQHLLRWLDAESLPVAVCGLPNIFCVFSRSLSGAYGLAVITSLSTDTQKEFSLYLSPEWEQASFSILDENGEWLPVPCERTVNQARFAVPLALMSPVVLMLSRAPA